MSEQLRKQFEQWYVENAFDLKNAPIGSRDCGLQWKAWLAAQAARVEQAEPSAKAAWRLVTDYAGLRADSVRDMVRGGLGNAAGVEAAYRNAKNAVFALASQPPSQELSQPTADEIAEAMECEFSARADGSWPDDDISVVKAWLKHGPAILAARGSKP